MKLYEYYGMQLTPLGNRLQDSKVFANCDKNSHQFLQTLNSRMRNRILNYGVGIEIEVEASPSHPVKGWVTVADGSLRNNGMEYKTIFGSRVHNAHELLTNLQTTFQKAQQAEKSLYEFNERCSVHIHLDVRNLTLAQLNSVLLLYTMFEGPLFRYAGESRRDNIFCVPIMQSVVGYKDINFKKVLDTAEKYAAFNLKAIREFGTIEFRHMEGNANADRIFRWILLLSCMLYYAEVIKNEDIVENIIKLKYESQYEQMISQVFGVFGPLLQINSREFDSAVSDAKLFINKGEF